MMLVSFVRMTRSTKPIKSWGQFFTTHNLSPAAAAYGRIVGLHLHAVATLCALTPARRSGGRALDARYPEALDEAINAALAPLRAGSAEAPERGRAEAGRGRASAPAQARRIAGFVAAALERGLRAPLGAAGGGAAGGAEPDEARAAAGFTVQRAIDAPAAELRILVRTGAPFAPGQRALL